MDVDPTFGAWLRQRRRILDLTQKELARQVGCAVVTIRKFEADNRRPSKALAERLADCLDIPPTEQANFIAFARAEPYLDPVSPPVVSVEPLPRPPPADREKNASSPHPVSMPLPTFLKQDTPTIETAPVFVARERELAELATALETARAGQGQILFVIGGAGRGKTMLVQEFTRRAQATDPELIVISGHCNLHTGPGDPYLPFREALTLLTGEVEAKWAGGLIGQAHARRLWEALPLTLPALVEHAPDLIGTFVPGPALQVRAATLAAQDAGWVKQLSSITSAEQPATLEQKRILTQYTALLKALAARRPLLLIIEDLHWVDTASGDLLFHLSRQIGDSRILMVGTYRPEEVTPSRPASEADQPEHHPLAEEAIRLSTEHGFPFWLTLCTFLRGWALAKQGHMEEGILQMRQGLAAYHATGAEVARPCFTALLVEIPGHEGRIEEGLMMLAEALTTMEKTGERFWLAEAYRLKGELLLKAEGRRQKDEPSPEACFLKAIEIARRQEAKLLELRAVMSLSRLRQAQRSAEKIAAARQMLVEIYDWFSEGFNTVDLQEAKELLDALS